MKTKNKKSILNTSTVSATKECEASKSLEKRIVNCLKTKSPETYSRNHKHDIDAVKSQPATKREKEIMNQNLKIKGFQLQLKNTTNITQKIGQPTQARHFHPGNTVYQQNDLRISPFNFKKLIEKHDGRSSSPIEESIPGLVVLDSLGNNTFIIAKERVKCDTKAVVSRYKCRSVCKENIEAPNSSDMVLKIPFKHKQIFSKNVPVSSYINSNALIHKRSSQGATPRNTLPKTGKLHTVNLTGFSNYLVQHASKLNNLEIFELTSQESTLKQHSSKSLHAALLKFFREDQIMTTKSGDLKFSCSYSGTTFEMEFGFNEGSQIEVFGLAGSWVRLKFYDGKPEVFRQISLKAFEKIFLI